MFGCENMSPSQLRISNITGNKIKFEPQCKGSYQTPSNAENSVITGSCTDLHSNPSTTGVFPSSGSTPLSNILKITALLRRKKFHLSPDNPFLQMDSRPPPGTVFTSEDLCTGSQVDSRPPPKTVFTSEDLCTGRKRRRGNNKNKENSPLQSIRNNQAATVNKKSREPQCKGSYQTLYNAKNSVISGSCADSHSIPPSTSVFPSSGSTPLSNILTNTTLLRRCDFHLSSDNPFLKVDSRPPPGTVFTSEDLCTGRGTNKDKDSPSQSIRQHKATTNRRSSTRKPYQPRVNGLISMHINKLPTRIPLSNISNIDTSSGFPQKKKEKLKKKNLLAEITHQPLIAKFDDETTSSAGC